MQIAKKNKYQGVLFDLDGTLLDTAIDIAIAINKVRTQAGHEEISFDKMKPLVGYGSKLIFRELFGIDEKHPKFAQLREQFLNHYQAHLADNTTFFPNMEKVLDYLEAKSIPWGIVTNKLTRHTVQLLEALNLTQRPACVVCGDTLTSYKPDPEPILHACKLLKLAPQECIYLGDTQHDMQASNAAGTFSLVALYGYLGPQHDPFSWNAKGYISDPIQLLDWV